MKKVYTVIVIMLMFAGAYAQTSDSKAVPTRQMEEWTKTPPSVGGKNLMKSGLTFWMNLDSADSYVATGQGVGYSRFLWESNMHYTNADTVGGHYGLQKEMWVVYDTLVDAYNMNGPTAYSRTLNPTVHIDSLALWCGQVNFSTTDDTLVIKIFPTMAITGGLQHFPDTVATVTPLWVDTIYIPASAAWGGFNSTSNGYVEAIAVNQTVPSSFCVKYEYWGSKQDTFKFVAGCPSFSGAASCSGYTMADSSYYHPNTFHKEVQFGRLYPTTTDGFVYYECNGTTGFQYGVDGYDYIQDLNSYIRLSGVSAGIQENHELGFTLGQNMPNPFNGTSDITYQLTKRGTVSLNITDIAGRTVMTFNEGAKDAGAHKITVNGKDLSQGVYFYTLNVDGYKLTNRMVVNK